ncbi:MAG: SGNH/GDSL hydrolase family protein [Isosphaerales bacterium]
MSTTTAIIQAAHAMPAVNKTPATLGPVGALGDSLTDEYRFYPPDRSLARNWVEILHTVLNVNFGPYTTKSRGEPRDQGFAYNWARSDATSEDMIANQLPGLTAQVAEGEVRYASILIGGDDFLDLLGDAKEGLIPPAEIPADLTQTTTKLITNVETAVATLLAANPNVKVAVWTQPDISQTPLGRAAAATSSEAAALLQAVSKATADFNSVVTSLASNNPRVALVDLASASAAVAGSPTSTITVAGQTISLTTTGDNYHDFYLADGLHIGTVAQGSLADLFIEAIDGKFRTHFIPITAQKIIRYAQKVQVTTSHPKGPQMP